MKIGKEIFDVCFRFFSGETGCATTFGVGYTAAIKKNNICSQKALIAEGMHSRQSPSEREGVDARVVCVDQRVGTQVGFPHRPQQARPLGGGQDRSPSQVVAGTDRAPNETRTLHYVRRQNPSRASLCEMRLERTRNPQVTGCLGTRSPALAAAARALRAAIPSPALSERRRQTQYLGNECPLWLLADTRY